MPPMLLPPKRAIIPVTQGRWNSITLASSHAGPVRTLKASSSLDAEEIEFNGDERDFILSILRAKPSIRDTKSYLASFNPPKSIPTTTPTPATAVSKDDSLSQLQNNPNLAAGVSLINELIDPVHRRTALVKLQGPFTDRQLESVARGMVYLEKLGLVSVVVVENDEWEPGSEMEREEAVEDAMRVVAALEAQGARARPVLDTIVRLGPNPNDERLCEASGNDSSGVWTPEAHSLAEDLTHIRSALQASEIPVLPALALDSFCRSVRISANDVIAALTPTMVEVGTTLDTSSPSAKKTVDMTPLRLMIVNREGGVPSYARSGLPHLLVNLSSEYEHIWDTFLPQWRSSHPTALGNLALARTCLSYMPRTSSAVMVSHRSPSSLIANLITNKPAQSSSLPHALLSGAKKLTRDTPTLFRYGLPIRVIRKAEEIDKKKMTALLEQSFVKTLDYDAFWKRVDNTLDFAIIAGDYKGGAIVTREAIPSLPSNTSETPRTMAYLDKFAVLPSHQGDGTVDFLWVALHDESYGLGTQFARNFIEGSMQGLGRGEDLVWRSRGDNPVNKWYYERSSGHLKMGEKGEWVLFWCDAEDRLKAMENAIRSGNDASESLPEVIRTKKGPVIRGPGFVVAEEQGRLDKWARIVNRIPSSWVKK
ncbi:Amino-acid acetyltransferase, mitochondrial [Serendipita sp. 400]|nr:Amino-acid acetyltransferase, mitochondrial [Serendipita sp. 400]